MKEEFYKLCIPRTKEYPKPVLERPLIEIQVVDPDGYLCPMKLEVNWNLLGSWSEPERRYFAHIHIFHTFEGKSTGNNGAIISYTMLPELIKALQQIKNRMDKELYQAGNI